MRCSRGISIRTQHQTGGSGRPLPVATPAPAGATVRQRPATTALPDTDFDSPAQVAALRVWAAAVRDHEEPERPAAEGPFSGAYDQLWDD